MAEARAAGLDAFNAGDMEAALSHFSYYFEREKGDLAVNLAFAEARFQRPITGGRHLLEAIDLYSSHGLKLLDRQPHLDPDGSKRREMLERLLRLYGRAGMRFEIIQTADTLLALDARHPDALAAKAEALCLNGDFADAQPLLAELIQMQPDELRWRGLYLKALSELGATQDERVEQCRTWAAEYQTDGRFHALAASLLLDFDREAEARDELVKAVDKGAAEANVLERACEMMDVLGMPEQTDAIIATAVKSHGDHAWPHEVRLRRLWASNRIDEAWSAIQEIHAEVSSPPSLLQAMALVCISAKEMDEADRILSLLRNSGGDAPATIAWADAVAAAIHANRHPLRARIEALDRAIDLNPGDAPLHVLAGDAWTAAREPARALVHYERAFNSDPAWYAAAVVYCEALLQAGRVDDAYHVAQILLNRASPSQARPIVLFAHAYLGMRAAGRLELHTLQLPNIDGDIRSILDHLHQENPANAEVASLYAQALLQLEGVDSLNSFAKQVVGTDAASREPVIAIADVYLDHRATIPQELLNALTARAAQSFPASLRAAHVLAMQGDAAAGMTMLRQAAPTPDATQSVAMIQFMIDHQLPGAADQLSQNVEQFPDSIEVQHLALSQPAGLNDSTVSRAMANLKRLVGDDSPQVKLAEAAAALRQPVTKEAALAKAILQIEDVLQKSPDSLAALTLMAEATSRGSNQSLHRAIECLERAASLYTGDSALLVRLVDLLQRQGEYDRAGRYLRVLARVPQASEGLRHAELRLWNNQGDFETALARAQTIVTARSPRAEQLLLAAIHHRAGKLDEAAQIYERLLATDSPEPFLLAQAADFYASTGHVERGVELIRRIEPANDCATRELIVGEFLLRHGHIAAAAEHLPLNTSTAPSCARAREILARYYLAVHDRAKARYEAMEGMKLDPANSSLRTLFAIASVDLPRDERQDAIEALRQVAGNEELIDTLMLLDKFAAGREGTTSPEPILDAARRLIDRHPTFLPAWQLTITLYAEDGRFNDAIALARRAVGRFPADPEPAQWSAELLIASGQWQAALAEAYEWERRSPVKTAAIRFTLASILLELDRADEAIDYLQPLHDSLIAGAEQSPQLLAMYVRALVIAGQVDRATAIITPLVAADERWRSHWLDLALAAESRYAPGMLAVLEPLPLQPGERLQLAGAWIELGRSGCSDCLERAEQIATALADSPDPQIGVHAMLVRGGIAEARHDWAGAETLYRRVLEQNPQHAPAQNNLAYLLARPSPSPTTSSSPSTASRLEEAMTLVDRALTLQPDDPDFLDTKATILLAMNRADEAQTIARKASQLRPNDLRIAISLAEAHLLQTKASDGDAIIKDLHQRIQLQRRVDPDLVSRFEALREKYQQTLMETGT